MSETKRHRTLRRSSEHGVVGGVAAGLARYLRVDPVIVRIGFIVSLFIGGLGVVAYAAAWLLVPDEHGRAGLDVGRAGLGETSDVTQVVGIVFIFFAASLVLGHWSDAGDVVLPLVLISAGAWLLLRRHPDRSEEVDPPPGNGPPTDHRSDEDHPVDDAPTAVTTSAGAEPDPTGTATATLTPPPPPPPAPKPQGPPTAQITFALVVLAGGAFGLATAVWPDLGLEAALITCLAITGAGLVAGAFLGRSTALIPLGITLLAALSVSSAVDVDLTGGIGDRRHTPASLDEVDDEYRLGMGEMVIDLRDLDPDDLQGETLHIDATVAIGSLEVLVPSGVEVTGSARAQLGDTSAFDQAEDGTNPDITVERDGPEGSGTIDIEAEVGLGEVQIR